MIKVDLKQFFRDRIWFGWWYRSWSDSDSLFGTHWVRDTQSKYRWKIQKLKDAQY